MSVQEMIKTLREKHGFSQDQLAGCVMVTRQAVSRWETGETQPNTDTLKLLSKEFDVSINTLLGSPRKLICQCCGMPLSEDGMISKEADGSFNEDYCKWCYADGTYTYSDMDDLIDVCVGHMANENFSEEQARSYMKQMLPKLDYWKRYDELSDGGQFEAFKKQLIEEINALHIEGMPKVEKLNALDAEYAAAVDAAPNKTMVFGDRFPFRYMTADYGITYYAAFLGCSAESEASFETISFLAGKLAELGLKHIVALESSDGKLAKTIVTNSKAENVEIVNYH